MTRRIIHAALLAALVAASGCVVPSVPLPPPDPESITFALDTTSGQATYAAGPNPYWGGATVSILNKRIGKGVITTANGDGSVDPSPPFDAADGDPIVIHYELPLEDQATAFCLILHDGPSSGLYRCQDS